MKVGRLHPWGMAQGISSALIIKLKKTGCDMAYNTKIQWARSSWNPWSGCHKVSAGCKFCYMYRDKDRFGLDPTVVQRSKSRFNDPLKWEDGRLIFTCSWSDFFVEEADQWRDEAWDIIRKTPHHTYQILTKRPHRIADCLPHDWGDGWDNVWLGVSIEDQKVCYPRLQWLLRTPAKVRFISAEPLLSSIFFDFGSPFGYEPMTIKKMVDWVIVGGESGNDTGKWRYRECNIHWIEAVIGQCQLHNIPVFVKQLGTGLSKQLGLKDRHGGDINEFPEHLRIRQMPIIKNSQFANQE